MIDNDFDPYLTLQNHDAWITQMATHNENLAMLMKEFANTQARDHDMIAGLTRTIQMQQRLISAMDLRIKRLEEHNEITD